MHNVFAGLCLLILAGIMNASFALPMKFTRAWAWENTWLFWSIFALIGLPVLAAEITIPELMSIYNSNWNVVLLVATLGAAWGVAQVLFGLALDKIGIALTFSIVLGLSAAMGSLIPLLRLHRDRLFTRSGLTCLIGVALVLVGVALSAAAGRMRDRACTTREGSNRQFTTGIIMALASGICASMMNVGFSYGTPLARAASEGGAKALWITNVIWVPLLVGGVVPNVIYCLYLLSKRGSMRFYGERRSLMNGSLALSMAILWFGSSVLYGAATVLLGTLGPVVGWPLFMSLIVIVASLLGISTGEWKHTDGRALGIQASAVTTLVIAVIVLSQATL